MKILLRTPVDQETGYGSDGVGLARALLQRGHDVRLSPSNVGVPIPKDIANLLTLPLDGMFDLSIHHLEPERVDLWPSQANKARRNVFWSMWEWEALENEPWIETFSDRIALFDYVVAYDQGTAGAFAPYTSPEKIRVVQGGFSSALWKPRNVSVGSKFVYGMNGRLNLRKGVYATYKAFRLLQEKHGSDFDAELVLKTTAPFFPPAFTAPEGITVIVDRWTQKQLQDFYYLLDCLVCPSWGEGKNLPALEALASGVPVILSDILGHKQWATSSEVSWVKTTPKDIAVGHRGGYVDPVDLAEVMWNHYTHKAAERSKAATAASVVRTSMDWSKCVERLSLQCGLML